MVKCPNALSYTRKCSLSERNRVNLVLKGPSVTHRPRILVIFPGALGDLLCFAPALRILVRRHNNAAVELMARAELARFAVGRLGVGGGHSIDRREVAMLFTAAAAKSDEVWAFFNAFERIYCFFAAANDQFREMLARVSGDRVSFYQFRPSGDEHVADGYVRALGENPNRSFEAKLTLLNEDEAAARLTTSQLGLRPGNYLLILPGSGSTQKNWPAENFLAAAREIAAILTPVFLLGPAEQTTAHDYASADFAVISGRELGEAAAIARMARGFLGNDSGISHLAAAAGARGVVLFGPTDPRRWHPLGNIKVMHRNPLAALSVKEVVAMLQFHIGSPKVPVA
jgi:heptosyltransferase-3